MAIWRERDIYTCQALTKAIFNYCHIECETEFWWVAHLDKWEGWFKTKFKYLSINERYELTHDFSRTYDNFVDQIEVIREKVAREYNYYFNAIWC